MFRNLQVAALNLQLLSHYMTYQNKTWQIYVNITVSHSWKKITKLS